MEELDLQYCIERGRIFFPDASSVILEQNPARNYFITPVDIMESGFNYSVTDSETYFGDVNAVGYNREGEVQGVADSRRGGSLSSSQ